MSVPIRSDEPLGPLNYQDLHDGRALSLVDIHEPFLTALQTESRLIIGRKGCGKSTILYAHQYFDDLRPRLRKISNEAARHVQDTKSRHVIVINSHREFEPIVKSVYEGVIKNTGSSYIGRTTESIRDEWEDRLWFQIISYFYSLHVADPFKYGEDRFSGVIAYCDRNYRKKLLSMQSGDELTADDIVSSVANIHRSAKNEILKYLKEKSMKCFLLIDSLEEYPVCNDSRPEVVKGFLPAIELIQRKCSPYVQIIATIPEEIESIFSESAGNEPGKDFSSFVRMRWKPHELKRVIAYRFVELIKEILREDSLMHNYYVEYDLIPFEKLLERSRGIDFTSHRKVDDFLSILLPKEVTNRMGEREDVWVYLIRHTHLCPRHLLILFTNSIKNCGEYWRKYGKLTEDSIVRGAADAEGVICLQVSVPFKSIYPTVLALIDEFCHEVPTFFGYRKLLTMCRVVGRQLVNPATDSALDAVEAFQLLYKMGVIGVIDSDNNRRKGAKYTYVRYFFTSDGTPKMTEDAEYCLHPVFSGKYEARSRSGDDRRLSYPVNVEV